MNHGKQRLQTVANAALFRTNPRTIFPNAAHEEREVEMHYGSVKYTSVKLLGSPNLNQYAIDINLKEVPNQQTFGSILLT
jgi:hypothetical protein